MKRVSAYIQCTSYNPVINLIICVFDFTPIISFMFACFSIRVRVCVCSTAIQIDRITNGRDKAAEKTWVRGDLYKWYKKEYAQTVKKLFLITRPRRPQKLLVVRRVTNPPDIFGPPIFLYYFYCVLRRRNLPVLHLPDYSPQYNITENETPKYDNKMESALPSQ